jgi:hypothetical protein
MVQIITGIFLLLVNAQSFGFALLSGPTKARLPVTRGEPRITFLVGYDHPRIVDKDEFLDGMYEDLDDEEFWFALIREAMNRWNDVPGAYVELVAEPDNAAAIDDLDHVFSITIGDLHATAAAAAMPTVEEKTIVDCDILVKDTKTKAKTLAYTLMHELGHCLGLGHNHSDYNAVMGYSRTSQALSLGADDKAGIIYLYPNGDKPPQELISCATIAGAGDAEQAAAFGFLFILPLTLVICRRKIHLRR